MNKESRSGCAILMIVLIVLAFLVAAGVQLDNDTEFFYVEGEPAVESTRASDERPGGKEPIDWGKVTGKGMW